MAQDVILQRKVDEVRTRIRLLLAQQWMCVALTYAALAGLLLVAATKMRWWTDAVDYLWALLLLAAVIGLVYGWTRRITPLVAAQIADERGALKERLSTAVELAASDRSDAIASAQIADASQHAERLRVSEVLPWQAPRQLRYLAGAVAVLLAVIFVPELPIFHSRQERLDAEAMKAEGVKIQQLAKAVEKKAMKKEGDKNDAIVRRIAQNMKQLGKDLARNRIPKKQAMLQMNELTKQLKDAESKVAGGTSQKSMDKVASDLMQEALKQHQSGNSDAARALQQMAQNLEKRDLEGAKRQLEELAKKMHAGKMTPGEMKATSEMLQKMAQSMQGSTLEGASEQMKDAAKQLQEAAKTAQQMQAKMDAAKTDAERKQIQQQMQQALQQQMAQAGQQCNQAGGT